VSNSKSNESNLENMILFFWESLEDLKQITSKNWYDPIVNVSF